MMVFAVLLAATVAASHPAPPTAIWKIDGPPGSVRSVTGAVKTGGRIVADGFINGPDEAREEAEALGKSQLPVGSCARAANVRPFTRLRRFAADGRLLWTWDASRDSMAIRLMGSPPGDCLSPDGGRLLVITFISEADAVVKEIDGRVLAVDRRPRFMQATGRRTGMPFGALRQMGTAYWQAGGDATLFFTLYDPSTDKETPDAAVLGRRP